MFLIWSLLAIFYCYWYFQDTRSGKHRPPGPRRQPLLGNMIQIAKADPFFSHLAFHKLSEKFGGLMRLKVGFQDVVVVSDFKIMQDMLAKDVFSGRHFEGYMKERSFEKDLGIIFTSGEMWNVLRKFTVKNLRDYGFGRKQTMENTISGEVKQFLTYLNSSLASSNNSSLRVERLFHLSLLNVLWSMVGGKTFSHDDPQLLRLLKINEDLMRAGNFGANLAFAFPFVAVCLPSYTGVADLRKINGVFQEFIREIFAEHRRNGKFASQPSSFIDVCLNEIAKNADNPSSYINEEQLMITIMDLLQVGSETTGNTLSYAILFMVLYPQVQQNVFDEINSAFPGDSLPTYEDRTL
ncbi:unnamed protein product [Allacma fusca]|uniref:Cytochrome P450 n=1 Tax=Allacma fusca TaxID=39272 RepID=A0A8J2J7P0_9HEXA|nr:unnamed protein product [Allacma fusca]